VPISLSYRYYGSAAFVMNDETFTGDTGTDAVMYYAFDMDGDYSGMEEFLGNYTQNTETELDYESKETYVEEFESLKSMFLMLGGVLSFIIALVGVLNFLNAMLTGIMARKREFAMLQSIGMTGRQLKFMLICEGMYYTLGSIMASLLLSIGAGMMLGPVLSNMFWFFTYRFTLAPVLIVTPIFAVLGVLIPLVSYHFVAKVPIIERLREAEA